MTFPWLRYWYPRGAHINVQGGVLNLPQGRFTAYETSAAVPLEALHRHNCLVLLGEPGMGKTYALRNYQVGERAQMSRENLGELSTPAEVRERIFESTRFQDWLNSCLALRL